MLQLLLLYRRLCGDHFYVILPPGEVVDLRFCFILGVNTQLSSEEINNLFSLANATVVEAKKMLGAAKQKLQQKMPSTQPDHRLIYIIGRDLVNNLSKVTSKGNAFTAERRPWLSDYLRFCEEVADVAIHEGKKLGFTIVVSGGNYTSRRVERVSGWGGEGRRFKVQYNDDLHASNSEVKEAISLLLGNYSFLQEHGAIIQASPYGDLLFLGRGIPADASPEELADSEDCYVISIEKNRDIKVYFEGVLALWRRGAKWVVPTAYGREYKKKLFEYIRRELSSDPGFDLDVFCDTVWKLSNEGIGGATFVLGDWDSGSYPLKRITFPMTEVFSYAEGRNLVTRGNQDVLISLSVQDGATVIDWGSGRVYGRRQLTPVIQSNGSVDLPNQVSEIEALRNGCREGRNDWSEWHKTLRWGTRHLNALVTALKGDGNAVAITVSSDGDIHVFGKNAGVPELSHLVRNIGHTKIKVLISSTISPLYAPTAFRKRSGRR